MPMPQHCIECDKVAVVLNNEIPYCTKCYKERSRKSIRRAGHLFKTKVKNQYI